MLQLCDSDVLLDQSVVIKKMFNAVTVIHQTKAFLLQENNTLEKHNSVCYKVR